MNNKKIIIYIRTSTEDQEPENQIKDCQSVNQYGDYEIIKDKQSAWKDTNREGFENLRELIKQGQVEHLIVWDLDRLYRNRKKLISFFQFCKIYKCKIHSVNQHWLESLNEIQEPFNEIMFNLMLQIMGWLAEDESKKKSERVKLAVRKEKGKPTLSYKGNKWGRKEVPRQVQEKIIELYKQGKSYREICIETYYWDSNRNKKYVSMGYVHKIISKYKQGNYSY